MNKAFFTFSILASLGVAAAVTSFASEVVNAQEIDPATKTEQTIDVREDCSSQVWPNFSPSCLRGRNVQVTVRNVSVATPDRR